MFKAQLNNLRIAPRKVRLVANLIKGMSINEAKTHLKFLTKKSALPILKLLNSAVSNIKNFKEENLENLYISKIEINEGSKIKRWQPTARGRATPIIKRTSCIKLALKKIDE